MKTRCYLQRCFAIWLISGFLSVYAESLVNGSFESGFDGWSVTGNASIQTSPPYVPTAGVKLAAFNAEDATPGGSISQSVATVPGRIHALLFDVGNLSYNPLYQKLHVQVMDGANALVSDTIHIPGAGGGSTTWIGGNYGFTVASNAVTLTLSDVSDTTVGLDLVLDRVRLVPSCFLYVSSVFDSLAPGVEMTMTPESIDHQNGGASGFTRRFYEGETVTLTAPVFSHGKMFHEWVKDGVHFTTNPSATFTVTSDMNMRAVYAPVLSIGDASPFTVRGIVGKGPFFPLTRLYIVTNESTEAVEWTASVDVPDASSCLTVWPNHGVLAPLQSAYLQISVTAGAFDLVAGSHPGRLVISTPQGSVECPASLTALDPDCLITNGSFESGLDGWTATGHASIESESPYQPTDGIKTAAFNSTNREPNGILIQTFATEPGVRYVVDFDVGVLSYNSDEQRLRVEMRNVSNPVSFMNDTLFLQGTGGGSTVWMPKHYEFIAQENLTELVFSDLSPHTVDLDLLLDHVLVYNPDYHLWVTTAADENDGVLGAGSGDSLREILQHADLVNGANRIHFASALDGATLPLGGTQLTVNSDVAIDASDLANGIILSGSDTSSVVETLSNTAIHHLTITGGSSGGIHNGGEMMLIDSRVQGNLTPDSGGGIQNSGSLLAHECVITGNKAGVLGGGISNNGPANFTRSTISDNVSDGIGGGISCSGAFGYAWVVLKECTVSGNTAINSGGGYSGYAGYKSYGNLYASNTTFAGNSAGLRGGAITGLEHVDLRNCTISANTSTDPSGEGGGIHAAELTLENSIVAANNAANNPDISESSMVLAGVNFVGADPKLAPLGNHGGLTLTMPPLHGSPIRDTAGTPSDPPDADQRGLPRISGSAMDIGAVETQQMIVNTLADENNGILTGSISLRDAVAASSGLHIERIGFDPALNGGTIALNGTQIVVVGTGLSIDASDLSDGITVSGSGLSNVLWIIFSEAIDLRKLKFTGGHNGAVMASDCSLAMTDCTFYGNSSTAAGGALAAASSNFTYVVLSGCTFSSNHTATDGGAISNGGIMEVWNSTFSGNSATGSGGAISSGIFRNGTMTIRNSTFAGNIAGVSGGAIRAGTVKLIHSTLSGNSCPFGIGGALAITTGGETPPGIGFSISNSVVAGNSAGSNDEISGMVQEPLGVNFIGGNPVLAPLAIYVGSTATMPPLPGSPLIEAALLLASTPPTDQAGHSRPSGPHPDIGAVEAFPFSSLPLVDSDTDGIDDRLEGTYGLTVGDDDSDRDTDGDGSTDAMEIANMTDPTDPHSLLNILQFSPTGSFNALTHPEFDLTFRSFPGLYYTLECSENLDFSLPTLRSSPLGTASGFTTTERIILLPGRDFVRVRRDP